MVILCHTANYIHEYIYEVTLGTATNILLVTTVSKFSKKLYDSCSSTLFTTVVYFVMEIVQLPIKIRKISGNIIVHNNNFYLN